MYRAAHSFSSSDPGILSFYVGDEFEYIAQHDDHWVRVRSRNNGRSGLAPVNYLNLVEDERMAVLSSIDRGIEAIHQAAAKSGGKYSQEQRLNLQKLINHRKATMAGAKPIKSIQGLNKVPAQPLRAAPFPPAGKVQPQNSTKRPAPVPYNPEPSSSAKTKSSVKTDPTKRQAPTPPLRMAAPTADKPSQTSKTTVQVKDVSSYIESLEVPAEIGLDLTDLVRMHTDLSYDKSILAVETVLTHVKTVIPDLCPVMDKITHSLFKTQDMRRHSSDLLSSHDGLKLMQLFEKLTSCKDDAQQRSWALFEDESIILRALEDLLSVLVNANPEVCCAVLRADNYDCLHSLVLYYQMEVRRSIRLLLLQTFGGLCSLEKEVVSELLCSVLPVEIARDMITDSQDAEKLNSSSILLTMVFFTGDPLPLQHYDQLNESFVSFLLDTVEDPPDTDVYEQIQDNFVALLLAFNQHFYDVNTNSVMSVLAERKTSKTFSEKIMLLVNRGDDPVKLFDYHTPCPDSMLKFLSDIFSSSSTSDFFFTNDLFVLIDIIYRHLADLSPGDKLRTEYLSLCHSILTNGNYREHRHRQAELKQCFDRIAVEEEVDSEMDRIIVQTISRDFRDLFPLS